jgi:PleD family two-component response regulator
LISRKIAQILLDTIKFRDMVFEFGQNGFAGILQNMNLDETMKIADDLYSGIDAILMELSFDGQITIGLTTRTARLLPASRMIEEAVSAAKKAEEEPSLPIVAFRANPEKYRNFVSENTN